jgi:3-hydroxyisobutyrate dehydrogenase-like beta-hydroxyacid dehydrogenase
MQGFSNRALLVYDSRDTIADEERQGKEAVTERVEAALPRVGVVGLGKMGSAISSNLLERGYPVSVWNIDPDYARPLVERGATHEPALKALVESAGAVIVSLWGDDAAREVTLDQVIPAAREAELIVEMSTLSPATYARLESAALERGVEFLAAPVLGSVGAAREGSLTVLAGGREATFERARALLEALGAVTYLGSVGASGYLKLSYNTIIGVVANALAELLPLCERAGVERRLTVETLTSAFGRIAGSKTQMLLDRDTEPRFSLNALLKDLLLAREAAGAIGSPLPILASVLPRIEAAAANGLGERDYIAVALEPAATS